MRIDPSHKPKPEEKDPQEVKESIIAELRKQPDAVLTLAYMYAKGYDLVGEDVTSAWVNAYQNTQVIETAYRKGYEDCEKDLEQNRRRDFVRKVIVDRKGDGK